MKTLPKHTRKLVCQMRLLTEELQGAGGRVLMRCYSGVVILPGERVQVILNPMERTLYRLYLAHPDGISADNLLLYRKELDGIYEKESCFDDPDIRTEKLDSLCGESKQVFYSTVSRIKKKFVQALGPWRAEAYIIKNEGGVYKARATLQE